MRYITLALALGVVATTTPALAETWNIDAKHSQAGFKVKHMMVSNVNGTITGIKGNAEYDGKNVKGLSVNADLDVNTINTSEAGRDTHLKGPDFFDAEKYPTISFKSKRAEQKPDGHFQLIGDLTMHGVTKEVAMDVEGPSQIVKDPKGNEHVGASAHTSVKRSDFGVGTAPEAMIGNDIAITLDVEMIKAATDKKASR